MQRADARGPSFAADRPTLIVVRSTIGFGSPNKADSQEAHGAALGEEEVRLTKAVYGWPENEKFLVPGEVLEHFQNGIGARGENCTPNGRRNTRNTGSNFPSRPPSWN